MAELTLGQRIAQRRKLLGLSQEAMGEKLGVSRQAISKWEADGTVPEIDKLIAASKLFGVTVGWLLGTEDGDSQEAAEAFSDEQLKIVEEIVRRYRQPEPDPEQLRQQKRRQTLLAVLACGAVLVLMFMAWRYVETAITGMNNSVNSLYYFYNNLYSHMAETNRRLDELALGTRLLSEYTLEAEAWEDLSGATVRFTGFRAASQEGDTGRLAVWLEGKEVASIPCESISGHYTAQVQLPSANGYQYYFQVLHPDGKTEQQKLDKTNGCGDLRSNLTGYAYIRFSSIESNQQLVQMERLELFYVEPKLIAGSGLLQIQDMTLVLKSGMEIQERIPLLEKGTPCEKHPYVTDFMDLTPFHFTLNLEFPGELVGQKETVLSVELVLNNGSVVEQPLYRWYWENGGVETEIMAPFS